MDYSEKTGKYLRLNLFWGNQPFASCLLFVYGYLRDDFAIMLGQVITYYIYVGNIQLEKNGRNGLGGCASLSIFPAIILVYGFNNNAMNTHNLFKNQDIPFFFNDSWSCSQNLIYAQVCISMAVFRVETKSLLPMGFWLLSLMGSLLISLMPFLGAIRFCLSVIFQE